MALSENALRHGEAVRGAPEKTLKKVVDREKEKMHKASPPRESGAVL